MKIDYNKVKRYTCQYCKERYESTMLDYNRKLKTGLKRCCSKRQCIEAAAMKVLAIQKKTKDKVQRQKDAQQRERLKSITVLHRELRTILQKIARMIDEDLPCICTNEYHDSYDGAHFWSVGAHPSIQHNMHNIHKCSVLSNQWRSGDENRYRKGLVRRYGQDYFDIIDQFPLQYPILKLHKSQVRNMKSIAQRIVREWDEHPMTRNEVNIEIGIYDPIFLPRHMMNKIYKF